MNTSPNAFDSGNYCFALRGLVLIKENSKQENDWYRQEIETCQKDTVIIGLVSILYNQVTHCPVIG
jgi:hypothetical protein